VVHPINWSTHISNLSSPVSNHEPCDAFDLLSLWIISDHSIESYGTVLPTVLSLPFFLKVVLIFEFEDEIQKCDHLNESY